jgi:hypothetical protein
MPDENDHIAFAPKLIVKAPFFGFLHMPTRKQIETALAKIPTTNCTHCMESRRKLLKMLLDRLPPEK